jgi:hypothetical protein
MQRLNQGQIWVQIQHFWAQYGPQDLTEIGDHANQCWAGMAGKVEYDLCIRHRALLSVTLSDTQLDAPTSDLLVLERMSEPDPNWAFQNRMGIPG